MLHDLIILNEYYLEKNYDEHVLKRLINCSLEDKYNEVNIV